MDVHEKGNPKMHKAFDDLIQEMVQNENGCEARPNLLTMLAVHERELGFIHRYIFQIDIERSFI